MFALFDIGIRDMLMLAFFLEWLAIIGTLAGLVYHLLAQQKAQNVPLSPLLIGLGALVTAALLFQCCGCVLFLSLMLR